MDDKNKNFNNDLFWSDVHEYIDKKKLEIEDERKKRRQIENHRICPNCQKLMGPVDFHKVYIDLCPSCGGVFLDKGELELLFRSNMKVGFIDSLKNFFSSKPS